MTRPKPRRMKPTRGWALVNSEDAPLFRLFRSEQHAREYKEQLYSQMGEGAVLWRIARVRITEIARKRK